MLNLLRIILISILVFVAVDAALPKATKASWYGEEYDGKIMANGKPFNHNRLYCATNLYPIGTKLVVCHKGKLVFVTVTDRGPIKSIEETGVVIDLSYEAFREIADPREGVIVVAIQKL